ncbi:MAG: Sip1-related alpha-galactosidase [Chitinophagales bacterium]
MKHIVSIFILFGLFTSAYTQISSAVTSNGLNISAGKVQRLTNGTGFIEAKKAGHINISIKNDVALLSLDITDTIGARQFAGIFFNNIPQLKQGVTIWRYKPWNSWTKPIAITDATKMQDWDVQFFYWQYEDGFYGAAVPLSGNGFRTTLGSESNKWGSKAVSYASNKGIKKVPAMAIAFGKDPYDLFAGIYRAALEAMGKSENEFSKKILPEPLQYIGWCTWNSSNLGQDLNEEHIIEGVKTFTDKKFPLGWVLIDDGWFQNQNSQLQSLLPDPKKFPHEFKPLIDKLKNQYGVKFMGVWHAFNGYWNGIDPASSLGIQYKEQLFSWNQPERADVNHSPLKTYYFINPGRDNLYRFYSTWHQYFKSEGFDFVKVDNQLVAERMASDNFPLFDLSDEMHKALYQSVNKYFKGAIINCMDMTADAYLNFGSSAVARTVEDYFPYEEGETYNLQHGNAAAHVLQAVYNSIYFSQMVFTDYDMFQSHNPNAILHAIVRTINNGPIYLTDKPGQQNFDILNKIVFADGKSIRSETSLLPAEDCLFQLQDPKLFKAYSKVRNTGLLLLFNAADTNEVTGSFKPADVHGLNGEEFALYEYFSGDLHLAKRNETFKLHLPRMGFQLQFVVPIKNGFAPFGLVNKYNAPGTIISEKWKGNNVELTLYEGGSFKAYSKQKPKRILVNGNDQPFSFSNNIILAEIPSQLKKPVASFFWE